MQLQHELDQLKKLVFGSKHERFQPSLPPEQQRLAFAEEVHEQEEPSKQVFEVTRTKKKQEKAPFRMPLPESLPREKVIIEPSEDIQGWKKIGEEITEELESVPGKLFVRQYVRPKYARPEGEGVVIGDAPVRPIEKGIAGPGLLAQIILDKFVDHLPVYRQIERFKRAGIKLPSSTINDWISGTCQLLAPLYEVLKEATLQSRYLQADETPIKVLDKKKKKTTHRGYHWVYHAPQQRLVVFDYREGRGREGPEEILKTFTGYLQTDGYNAYEAFDTKAGIQLMHCMAHARRKFYEAQDNDEARAIHALSLFQKLYSIESKAREQELTAEEIKSLREEKSVPVLKEMERWLLENYKEVLPQSPIGKAVTYSLQRWEKLSLYVKDGSLLIDNNLVENAIRPVAVGRKNYLFAGSHDGAKRAAMLYSFLGTCKLHDVNPMDWLKDVLRRIPEQKVSKLNELLPGTWKPLN